MAAIARDVGDDGAGADPLQAATAFARDGCAVETGPLADMLDAFVSRWNRTRPPRSGGKFTDAGSRSVAFVGAIQSLVQETRLQEGTIERVIQRRSRYTELRTADPLLAAIDETGALYDGRLRVVPNPAASARARAACQHCGGSSRAHLNGAGLF